MNALQISRRALLSRAANGFGALALGALLQPAARTLAATTDPLAPRPSHFRPRAKNVIFLFMEGGVSQVDSFDPKPRLTRHHGEDPRKAIGKLEKTQFENVGTVFKCPWEFRQHGQSGLWISDLFPHVARHADDLCVLRSMTSAFPEHTSANYFLHSGLGLQGRPSMGAWVAYGLGSSNHDLPGFVVLNGGLIPPGGVDCFGNGFLPATYQGTLVNANGAPLPNVAAIEKDPARQSAKQRLAQRLNRAGLLRAAGDDALESAIANAELAGRMQSSVPDFLDLSGESEATRQLYGCDAPYAPTRIYARECLLARRLIERGVRFVELTIPKIDGLDRWDAHSDILNNHGNNARAVDQPIAGLLSDLKARGLLDDTLVVWAGEFGRTPFAQGSDGRDHHEHAFSVWLAGGGTRGGSAFGQTDEWGYRIVENPLQMHDLHATILHLLGMDHTRLTYRFGGRDIRLTDVHGEVIQATLA
jgi:hypothetical protein